MKYVIRKRFNPNHHPAGAPGGIGGQFAPKLNVANPEALMELMEVYRTHPDYHPNIIRLQVNGQYIFHPDEGLGLKRIEMPQIPSKFRPGFLADLPHQLIDVDPRTLFPTQNELDGHKVSLFATRTNMYDVIPLISQDGYVIDGHHNWAGAVVRAVVDPMVTQKVHAVSYDRDVLMKMVREYSDKHGFEAKDIKKFNPNHVPAGSPRGGQFTSADDGVIITYDELAMQEFENEFYKTTGLPFKAHITDNYGKTLTYMATQTALDLHEELKQRYLDFYAKYPKLWDALGQYQGIAYGPLNYWMRNGGNAPKDPRNGLVMSLPDAINMRAMISAGIESGPTIPDGTVLYRAFRSQSLVDRALAGNLVGGIFKDKAFMSTTLNAATMGYFYEDKRNKSNAVLLRMTARNHMSGLYLMHGSMRSSAPTEFEYLLPSSTEMHITGVTPLKTGGIIVDADVYGKGVDRKKFNPNHEPAGTPKGGQFAPATGVVYDLESDPAEVFDVAKWPEDENALHQRFTDPAVAFFNSLTPEEHQALGQYQMMFYRQINDVAALNPSLDAITVEQAMERLSENMPPALRKARASEALTYAKSLEKMLQTAPSLPDGVEVYRSFRDKNGKIAEALANRALPRVADSWRFLSTSVNPINAANFLHAGAIDAPMTVFMKLTTKNARGLYLGNPGDQTRAYEYEVLFNRHSKVSIDRVRRFDTGAYHNNAILIEGTIGDG